MKTFIALTIVNIIVALVYIPATESPSTEPDPPSHQSTIKENTELPAAKREKQSVEKPNQEVNKLRNEIRRLKQRLKNAKSKTPDSTAEDEEIDDELKQFITKQVQSYQKIYKTRYGRLFQSLNLDEKDQKRFLQLCYREEIMDLNYDEDEELEEQYEKIEKEKMELLGMNEEEYDDFERKADYFEEVEEFQEELKEAQITSLDEDQQIKLANLLSDFEKKIDDFEINTEEELTEKQMTERVKTMVEEMMGEAGTFLNEGQNKKFESLIKEYYEDY